MYVHDPQELPHPVTDATRLPPDLDTQRCQDTRLSAHRSFLSLNMVLPLEQPVCLMADADSCGELVQASSICSCYFVKIPSEL
ncbi:hypothetical protein RRG08_000487 [Elysia crispata]|uniref:Uncharacterized protein n=1 Tax=Elysia crispata TaxID=231223 RepID=A0AAE1CW95_9GAST|nr:hypothetical protein RRG08_000487 [Elysia crispata]